MTIKLIEARTLFNKAPFEEASCMALKAAAERSTNPIIFGYYCAASIIATKYILNPFARMTPFKEAKNLLEETISENFEEVELRFIRYAIQRQAPKLLGYYKNLEIDKKMLRDYIKTNQRSNLTKHMMVYLKDTNDEVLNEI